MRTSNSLKFNFLEQSIVVSYFFPCPRSNQSCSRKSYALTSTQAMKPKTLQFPEFLTESRARRRDIVENRAELPAERQWSPYLGTVYTSIQIQYNPECRGSFVVSPSIRLSSFYISFLSFCLWVKSVNPPFRSPVWILQYLSGLLSIHISVQNP